MTAKRLNIPKSTEVLLWVYGVGLAGMLIPFSRGLFMKITPLNLLFAALFLFRGRLPARRVIVTGLLIAVVSFLIEAIGTNTGKIFGVYTYGQTLGPALLNTPLIIGLNWFLLIYCTNTISRLLWKRLVPGENGRPGQMPSGETGRPGRMSEALFVVFAGSILMIVYDLFLEPAATRLDMWSWECGIIPLRNCVAWFFFSVLFHTITRLWGEAEINTRSVPLFAVQLLFFAVTDLFFIISG